MARVRAARLDPGRGAGVIGHAHRPIGEGGSEAGRAVPEGRTAVRAVGVAAVLAAVAFAGGCASGGPGGGLTASDELKEGVRAARRGYWQEALYRFERADRLSPQDGEILNNLAVALEAVGRYEDARALYARALAADPGDRYLGRNKVLFDEFYSTYVAPVEKPVEKPGEEAGHDAATP